AMTIKFMRAVLSHLAAANRAAQLLARRRHAGMRILLVSLALTVGAFAQQASITSIVGRVADSSGAAVPGASVTAIEDGTQQTYSGKTNEEGSYSFPFVRVGTYTIMATAPGFATMVRTGVVVQVNQVIRINLNLVVGQATEKVTVSAE